MTPERFQQIDKLLDLALEREPSERGRFLDEACHGDEALRTKLESLLRSHEQARGFLAEPPSDLASEILAARERERAAHEGSDWPEDASKILGRYDVTEKEVESLLASHEKEDGFLAEAPFKLAAQLPAGNAQELDSTSIALARNELAPGRIGSYKLVCEIGHGGMGTVYEADRADEQYRKRVAIKLIKRGMDSESILRRFKNERQILASLDHPNIARLLDGGTTEDGLPYFVMEYVEGQPLFQHCDTCKLPTVERLKLFRTICSAVHYAHQNLVVHRDLKPKNILVTADGVPKLLDFGIAKLLNPELSSQTMELTTPAVRLMTPEFASPEQFRGEPVTAASDIYSLGVLLYELLTGHHPYRSNSRFHERMAQLICEEEPEKPSTVISRVESVPASQNEGPTTLTPESVSNSRDGSPERLRRRLKGDLDNIVLKSMHKVPKSRYASVQQLSEDIRRHLEGLPVIARKAALRYRIGKFVGRQRTVLITGLIVLAFTGAAATAWQARTGREKPAGRVLKSMAVLPFVNVPADPSSEYFTDGITESIINSLSQLPDLRVIARTTAFRHKGRENEPQAVGRELAVDAVLTGTASQRDDSLTIQVDLVNVSDGSQLWGQRYKRKLVDILAVQEDVAESIVETLRLRLTSKIPKRVTKAYTENVEAYQLYLRGRYSCNMLSEEELHKGIHHLQQAIDLDPTYALAYSAAADCYDLLARYYFMPAYYPKARSAALRAIEIDGTLAEPHASLGYSMMLYDWDWHGAEKELKRALQLNPNYEVAHQWYGILLIVLGRFDQARSEMKRAQELDPLSFIINVHMGRAFYYSRQHDRAIEQLKKTLELYPHSVYSHSFYATLDLARAYEQSRMYNEAIDVLRRLQVPPSKSDKSQYDVDLAYAYAVTGRKRESMAILEHLISQPKENAPLVVLDIACIYAALGETDKAFEWIEKAYDEHLDRLIYIKAEPRYDPIRSDPRFANILRRMRLGP